MRKSRLLPLACLVSLLLSVVLPATVDAAQYPRTANYFLRWSLTPNDIVELAKWDVVILDMEIQVKQPDAIRALRAKNPRIIILAYITPQEIFQPSIAQYSSMRTTLSSQIADAWYLRNSYGEKLSFWQGTSMLNISAAAPLVNGVRWQDVLTQFVVNTILGSGLWDGVFYDNGWDKITDHVGWNIDADRNGVQDPDPNAASRDGMNTVMQRTRQLTGGRYRIVVNGSSNAFLNTADGMMVESLIAPTWGYQMNQYRVYARRPGDTTSNITILNANVANVGGENQYRIMRYGLVSALLENGYYSFDHGDKDHGQTWRYDEYGVQLGEPLGDAISKTGRTTYGSDVWQRQFTNGLAVVNGTSDEKTVDLGGEYEKIRGVQDPSVNDGSIVSELTIAPYDGQVLLKTFAKADDVVYPNGAFLRFFHADGKRARNGFFAFEEGQRGGDLVARIDLNNNGARDLLVVSGNKLLAWRDDGQPYMAVYPYTAQYAGELRAAVGDLDADGKLEVVVGPGPGYKAPIKVYSYDGVVLKDSWYPFGTAYKSGYSLAIGKLGEPGSSRQIVVGMGKGAQPTVTTFSSAYKKIRSWFSYESWFRGGVSVATGDVNGDGIDEIVTGPGPGKKPVVRVFNRLGKQIVKEFTAFTAIGTPGATVGTADVDFDGKKEIVTMSKDVGQ